MRRVTTLLHRLLTQTTLWSSDKPLRSHGRTRRSLFRKNRIHPRNSKAIFRRPFCVPFHQPGLSGAYLPAYSPLHRLWLFRLNCILHREREFVNSEFA